MTVNLPRCWTFSSTSFVIIKKERRLWESHRNTLALLLFKDQVHNGFQEVVGILLADLKKKAEEEEKKRSFQPGFAHLFGKI